MVFSNEQKGSLYAITSGFLYGFLGYFGMSAMNTDLSAANMLFWRFSISALTVLPMIIWSWKSAPRPQIQEMWKAYLSGLLFYGTSTLLYFIASPYIGTGLSMVIFFAYPAMIMLINFLFYKAGITRQYGIAITIILIGLCLLIDLKALTFDMIGIALSLLSGLFYAAYVIVSKKNRLTAMPQTLLISLGCMTTSLIVAVFEGGFFIPTQFNTWINLLGIGIIATALPVLLLLKGLEYISAEKGSILSVLEPVFVMFFGALLLHETISIIQLIGCVVILSGALLTLRPH
jgi:drug/metabolite transporter (DMT)-like permease